MDEKRIIGAAKEFGGKAQSNSGDLTGTRSTQAVGTANEFEGATEYLYGKAKDTAQDVANTASSAVSGRGGLPDRDRVIGTIRQLGGRTQAVVGDLIGSDQDSAEGRFLEAQGVGQELFGHAKDAARDLVDYAQDVVDEADDRLRDGLIFLRHQVAENPLSALLIAGVVGFAAATVLQSRR